MLNKSKPYLLIFLPVIFLLWFFVVSLVFTTEHQPSSAEILADFVPRKSPLRDRLVGQNGGGDLPSKEQRGENRKIVLFWTAFFGGKNSYLGEEGQRLKICSVSECILTDDRSLWNVSDALIFHPLDFNPADLPPARYDHQYYIYFVLESPHHSHTGPAGFFNLTFTYRLDSDIIADNYLQYFRPAPWTTEKDFLAVWQRKTKGIVIFTSNCEPPSDRQSYVRILQQFIPVDVFGACGETQCAKSTKDKCDELVREYKFYLAFENSICKDYVSEKAVRPYIFDAIPVFLGGANYSEIFPVDSFIDAQDYQSPKQLAEHLKDVANNKDAYAAYFKFRYRQPTNSFNGLPNHLAPENVSLCKLCKMLHVKNRLRKVHQNLDQWWIQGGNCKRPDWKAQFINSN